MYILLSVTFRYIYIYMKSIFAILKFTFPYYKLIIINTLFNFLSVLFSLFSISLVIPILGILFGTIDLSNEIPGNSVSIENIKNVIYSYIMALTKSHGKIAGLGFVCILLSCGTILKNSTRYFALYFLTPLRNNVIRDLRMALHISLLHSPLQYIRSFKKGDLVSRMTNDLTDVEWSIMSVLEFFIKDPIHIIVFLISLFYISPQLTLISLLFLPLTSIIITTVSKSLKKKSLHSQEQIGNLISLIEETLSNIKIIKMMNGYGNTIKTFNQTNDELKNINNKVLWKKDLASPMSELLSTIVMVIVIWWGGTIVLNSNLKPDVFIGFLLIFSQILPPAKSLTSAFYSIQKGSGSAKRISEVLNRPTSRKSYLSPQFNNELRFSNIYFKHQHTPSITDINLTITPGSSTAIVGESGSGKSTLIDLLLNLYPSESGEITVDGKNINLLCKEKYRALFSIVSQDNMLFNDSILNNIKLGQPNATLEEVIQAAKKANIHDVIMNTENDYKTMMGNQGDNLSGGEKQRITIARAILNDSPIMIFDEATSSLDLESERRIQKTLSILQSHKTIIIISHKLNLIKNCDNIAVLQKGELKEYGTHEELVSKQGIYYKLYRLEKHKKNEKN